MEEKDEKLIKETKRDTLQETEDIFGKRIENFNETERAVAFLNFIMANEKKTEMLSDAGDTNFRMKWDDFIALLLKNGFELQNAWAYDKKEKNPQMKIFKKPEELLKNGTEPYDILATFSRDGMLIVATSYGDSINGGNLYYERELKDGINLSNIKSLSSYGMFDNKKFYGYYDIREGLMVHIKELEEKSNPIPIWETISPRPWIISYVDEKIVDESPNKHASYDKLINSRISTATPTVRNLCSAVTHDAIVLAAGTYKDNDITEVNLSKVNISKIEDGAFENCPHLKRIIIDSNVKIPVNMIKNCPNLEELIVHGVKVPLSTGKIIDNSLTGIDELIARNKEYKDAEYIDDISVIKSKLEDLYEKAIKDNKYKLLEILTKIKENIFNKNAFIKIELSNGTSIDQSYYGDNFVRYDKDFNEEEISAEEFATIIDKLIKDVIDEKIDKISISSDVTGKIKWETESKEAKMIREDIEKISEEIKSISGKITEKQKDTLDEIR